MSEDTREPQPQDEQDRAIGAALRAVIDAMPEGKTITFGKNYRITDFRADVEYVAKLHALSLALPEVRLPPPATPR